MITNEQKLKADELAKNVAKYAFALAFYIGYDNAPAEIAKCRAELQRFTNELLAIVSDTGSQNQYHGEVLNNDFCLHHWLVDDGDWRTGPVWKCGFCGRIL